jgi:hypothetical protein
MRTNQFIFFIKVIRQDNKPKNTVLVDSYSMARQISLDELKELRLVRDKPIRLLLFAEATSNLGFLVFVFLYPSSFISFLLQPAKEITPLTSHLLLWWNSWIVVMTALMFAALPSKYNTPTLTAGLVHVRRFIYWALLGSEILLIFLLISTRHRTISSIGVSIFILLVIIGRLVVLFPKKDWFGTVLIESSGGKDKQR